MRSAKVCFFLVIIISLFSFCYERSNKHKVFIAAAADTFPIPPVNETFLFYVQRTPNTNTIVYELNLGPDGTIIKEDPVHIFWIRYKEDGSKEELSYLQRKYAYGLRCVLVDPEKLFYKLNFVSYSKRHLYLQKSGRDKKYHIYTYIAGKWSILHKIFVNIEGGTFWLPNIQKIEMSGRENTTGKMITEIFKP
jgi:hypothetical protein